MRPNQILVACVLLAAWGAASASPANVWKPGVASGNWSAAANWSAAHVPTAAETVYVTNTTAVSGYRVAADASWRSAATNSLVVGNASGKVNVLTVKKGTTLDFERAAQVGWGNQWDIKVTKGGRIVMEEGSAIRRRYGNYGEYLPMKTYEHCFIRLTGGASFEQQGGYFGITDNSRQGIWIGDETGTATNVWRMTGGVLNWNTGTMGAGNILCIDKTGRFEMSGASVFTNALNNGAYRSIAHWMQGGVFDMSEDSRLVMVHGNYHFFGWGDTILRDRALVTRTGSQQPWPYLGCAPSDPKGSVARLIVQDDAQFNVSGDPSFFVGGRVGCHAVLDCSTTAPCQFVTGFAFVGFDEGTAEAWFRGPGRVAIGGYSGLHVGAESMNGGTANVYAGNCARTSNTTAAPTGTVYLTGGTLMIGGKTSQAWAYNYLCGLVVGDGSRQLSTLTDPFENRNYCGRFYMSGGSVTNDGYLVVGVGRATGRMVQTGGTVYDNCNDSAPMVVGCAGGYGDYVLSNGTLTVLKNLYVGGATTGDLQRTGWTNGGGYPKVSNYPKDHHDAKGTFTVAGLGTDRPKLAVSEKLTVSSDGAGTFEVVGSRASVKAKNMTVLNNVSAVEGGESVVRFVADEDGLSQITVSKNVTIADGAKLEVDLTGYKGPCGRKMKIIDCATRTGAFAPENVRLTRCKLIQEEGDPDIYVKADWSQGLTIIFRPPSS